MKAILVRKSTGYDTPFSTKLSFCRLMKKAVYRVFDSVYYDLASNVF